MIGIKYGDGSGLTWLQLRDALQNNGVRDDQEVAKMSLIDSVVKDFAEYYKKRSIVLALISLWSGFIAGFMVRCLMK